MASLIDLLGLSAGAAVGARTAQDERIRADRATEQQTLLDTLKRKQEEEDRAQRNRYLEAQTRNLDSLSNERSRPATPTRRTQVVDGQIVDLDAGTARPIEGLRPSTQATQRRTQIVDGQIVDLDSGRARPIEGFTPPAPPVRQSMPTEGERKAAAFYASGRQGYDTLEGLLATGAEVPSLGASIANRVGLGVGNVLTSDQMRQMRQSALMLSDAWLRYTSGAAVPEQEVERFAESFIPRAGDDAQTLEQKKQARAVIIEALRKGAGRALDPNTPAGQQPSLVERYQLEPPE